MKYNKNRARLFVDRPLFEGNIIPIVNDQFHYLTNVLRVKKSQRVSLFNGQDGEWVSELRDLQKKRLELQCINQVVQQKPLPDIWCLLPILKKTRMDLAVEKATELGVSKICPIITDFTQAKRFSVSRLERISIEATEQCGGLGVPIIEKQKKLRDLLNQWQHNRLLIFCDEILIKSNLMDFFDLNLNSIAVIVGPEGGFSDFERQLLLSKSFVRRVSLGNRILRAETAVISALTFANFLQSK